MAPEKKTSVLGDLGTVVERCVCLACLCLCRPFIFLLWACSGGGKRIFGKTSYTFVPPRPLPARRRSLSSAGNKTLFRKRPRGCQQQQSLFFDRLPREIRDIIYRQVLGDRLILVITEATRVQDGTWNPKPGYMTSYERSFEEEEESVFIGSHVAWPYKIHPVKKRIDVPFRGAIPLLRTCWKIYTEAIPILYQSNKFIVPQNVDNIRAFASNILLSRLQVIRALEISLGWSDVWSHRKPKENTWKLLQSMQGLRDLTLRLNYPGLNIRCLSTDHFKSYMQDLTGANTQLRDLRRLEVILQCPTVVRSSLREAVESLECRPRLSLVISEPVQAEE